MNAPPESETPDWNRAPTSSTTSNAQSIADRDAACKAGEQRDAADARKAFDGLAARAAMAGCGLYRLADGEYLLSKWGITKACPDLRSVAALLDRMAGAA